MDFRKADRFSLKYDLGWAQAFAQEEQTIRKAIGLLVADVQHVGSTSIPGMVSKPILDIGVALARFEDGPECVEPLARLGYTYRGLSERMPGHRSFAKGDPMTHKLHMVETTNKEWFNLVGFRDYLIAHPDVAEKYAQVKRSLAEQFAGDWTAYTDAKRPFISGVLAKARRVLGDA